MPQFLNADAPDFETRFVALLGAKREDSPDVDAVVADIIADVRMRGDAAVIELTAKFDRLELADLDGDECSKELPWKWLWPPLQLLHLMKPVKQNPS